MSPRDRPIRSCEPDRDAGAARSWQTAEFRAATGRLPDERQAGAAWRSLRNVMSRSGRREEVT
jgi:hypothetical protein